MAWALVACCYVVSNAQGVNFSVVLAPPTGTIAAGWVLMDTQVCDLHAFLECAFYQCLCLG